MERSGLRIQPLRGDGGESESYLVLNGEEQQLPFEERGLRSQEGEELDLIEAKRVVSSGEKGESGVEGLM